MKKKQCEKLCKQLLLQSMQDASRYSADAPFFCRERRPWRSALARNRGTAQRPFLHKVFFFYYYYFHSRINNSCCVIGISRYING
jgi:hypothetical protein